MDIPSYDVLQEFARHGPFVVYRGRRRSDQQSVLLKASVRASPSRTDNDALERQFDLLRKLSVAGIPRAYALVPGDRTCLILEDRGLSALKSVLGAGRLDVSSVLTMAIGVCAVLDEIHRRRLTHGVVSPSSVLVSASGDEVQLLNVGLAPGLWTERRGAGSERGRLRLARADRSDEPGGRLSHRFLFVGGDAVRSPHGRAAVHVGRLTRIDSRPHREDAGVAVTARPGRA